MYLARLAIQGFKSFAHNAQLDFQAGITAIVGPNGSGKSNVAEAIRWALGEQSAKAVRAKRSDDVIFAGSDKKSRLGVAEVALHLNNEDQRAPVPYSELVLTRRVYRDGEGEYLINHQPSRLQDIQLLLAQANFGQRTYSVIGQGMIDSFLLSSPQERKHLFDEAAGVRQFQLKKEQAISKLSHAKENLAQGEAVMAEIEPRLRSLTRQVKRLERREEVEKELQEKQRLAFGLQWQTLDHELQTLRDQFTASEKRRQEIEHETQAIQTELETIERERTGSEVFAELQQRYNKILDQKNAQVQEQSVIKGKLELAMNAAGQGQTAFHHQRLQEIKRGLGQVIDELEQVTQTEHRASAQLQREQEAKHQLDEAFQGLEAKLADIKTPQPEVLKRLGQRFSEWHERLQELREALAIDQPDLEDVRRSAARLEDEVEELAGDIEQLQPEGLDVVGFQKSLIQLSQQQQQAVERVAASQAELQRALDQRQRLEADQHRQQAELEKLEQEASLDELAKTNPDEAYAALANQAKVIEKNISDLDQALAEARNQINNFNSQETTKKDRLFTLQKSFRDAQRQLNLATSSANDLRVELAKVEQRGEDLKREITQAMGAEGVAMVTMAAKEQLAGDPVMLAEDIGHLRRQLQLIGGIDDQTTHEYKETQERWDFLSNQADDLRRAIQSLESAIHDLESTIKQRFDKAFKKINQEFHQYFRTLFSGGKAELVLLQEVVQPESADQDDQDEDDEEEPVSARSAHAGEKVITGIEIRATPPGKKLQSIAMLSGGEKALTSIALLCAIISNNPSPFVVLDEVDAALDEANSQRFAAILEHLAKKTQFIVITHNRATMEKAKILYGVTMGDDGASQVLSVKMEDAEAIIQQHGNR